MIEHLASVTPMNNPMGVPGEWKPVWKVTAPLVIAKDQFGRLNHCYQGSLLGWLGDDQAEHFLRHNLIERVDDIATLPAPEAIGNCMAALDALRVEVGAGAPTARTSLREAGHKFSNDVVAAAVKQRKAVSKRLIDDADFDVITA